MGHAQKSGVAVSHDELLRESSATYHIRLWLCQIPFYNLNMFSSSSNLLLIRIQGQWGGRYSERNLINQFIYMFVRMTPIDFAIRHYY